jgi:hypothetical protein
MHILGAGRAAFLEFLRNLTPMVLMATVAVFIGARLDFTRVDLSNWALTVAFFVCAATAAFSFLANLWAFLDNAFAPLRVERAIRLLRYRGHHTSTLLVALPVLTWRARPIILFEAVVVLLIVYAAVLVATISAVSGATTALRNGLR